MSNNIRIKVPCNEVVRQTILSYYPHLLFKGDTLKQDGLNIDVVSFNDRRKVNQHMYRNYSILVLLNVETSRRYKQGITEASLASALEQKAYEIILLQVYGAFNICQCVSKSIDTVLSSLNLEETKTGKESIRKIFYRDRKAKGLA